MPSNFDVSFESTATVEQVHSTMCDENYWIARIAAFGAGGTTLDSLIVDPDGAVTVVTTQDLRQDALPGPVGKFYPRDLHILRVETWTPIGSRRVTGDISVEGVGAPVAGHGTASLQPLTTGSRLVFSGTVEFRLPLVGGKIESYLAGQLVEGITDIQRFTAGWITEHA